MQRPYSTLHSPDGGQNFSNPQASQYSLHTPIDENPFYTSIRPQNTSLRAPSPPIGTSPNDIPMQNQRSDTHPEFSSPPPQQYPAPMGTPAPSYSSPPLGPEPHSRTTSPYIPLSNLPSFPPPPTSETNPGPATSPPPTQHLPPVPPEPAHTPSYHPFAADRPLTPKTPIYTPGGASGPNGGVHAPGQIGHPNQQHGRDEYHHGLCDCFTDIGTCMCLLPALSKVVGCKSRVRADAILL